MNRFSLLIVVLCLRVTWSIDTHWMAKSVFDIHVINYDSDVMLADLRLHDNINYYRYLFSTGVSGTVEFKENVTDAYEVRIFGFCLILKIILQFQMTIFNGGREYLSYQYDRQNFTTFANDLYKNKLMMDLYRCSNFPQITVLTPFKLPFDVNKFTLIKCIPYNLILAIMNPQQFQKVVIHITREGERLVDIILMLQGITFNVMQYLSMLYGGNQMNLL